MTTKKKTTAKKPVKKATTTKKKTATKKKKQFLSLKSKKSGNFNRGFRSLIFKGLDNKSFYIFLTN